MSETEFVSKTEAIDEIRQITKYGRYIIERQIDLLFDEGRIEVISDPGDHRRKLISRDDIQVVIAALKPAKRA